VGRAVLRELRYLNTTFPGLDAEIELLWPGLIGVRKDFVRVVGSRALLPEVHFVGAGAGLAWSGRSATTWLTRSPGAAAKRRDAVGRSQVQCRSAFLQMREARA
jgi:hypothetical protein